MMFFRSLFKKKMSKYLTVDRISDDIENDRFHEYIITSDGNIHCARMVYYSVCVRDHYYKLNRDERITYSTVFLKHLNIYFGRADYQIYKMIDTYKLSNDRLCYYVNLAVDEVTERSRFMSSTHLSDCSIAYNWKK